MTRPCRWCPFTACDSCPWKGGERLANSGLTCDNGVTTKRSPGAVLGRSGSTGDLTDMEVSAVQQRTPKLPRVVT